MTFGDFMLYAWDWRGVVIFFAGVVVGILLSIYLTADDYREG